MERKTPEHPLILLKQRALKHKKGEYRNEIITFLNPYSYLSFRKNTDLFCNFDRIYFDGIVLVKSLKLIGIRSARKSFDMTSLAREIFELCVKEKKSIYFVGSDQHSIESFVEVIKGVYPDLGFIGWRNGFFTTSEEREIALRAIAKLAPDFLIVGMGTPLQERFLSDMKALGWKGVGFTCGGFIHQTSTGINYYPKWINNLDLRWLYRIWDEPKLLNRYLFQYPKFAGLFIYDLMTIRRQKKE